jgi:hypothetical protein
LGSLEEAFRNIEYQISEAEKQIKRRASQRTLDAARLLNARLKIDWRRHVALWADEKNFYGVE